MRPFDIASTRQRRPSLNSWTWQSRSPFVDEVRLHLAPARRILPLEPGPLHPLMMGKMLLVYVARGKAFQNYLRGWPFEMRPPEGLTSHFPPYVVSPFSIRV